MDEAITRDTPVAMQWAALRGSPAAANCPVRDVLDRLGDTWSVLVILILRDGPHLDAAHFDIRRSDGGPDAPCAENPSIFHEPVSCGNPHDK